MDATTCSFCHSLIRYIKVQYRCNRETLITRKMMFVSITCGLSPRFVLLLYIPVSGGTPIELDPSPSRVALLFVESSAGPMGIETTRHVGEGSEKSIKGCHQGRAMCRRSSKCKCTITIIINLISKVRLCVTSNYISCIYIYDSVNGLHVFVSCILMQDNVFNI